MAFSGRYSMLGRCNADGQAIAPIELQVIFGLGKKLLKNIPLLQLQVS
jgi:hypothetical protein